MCNIPSLMPGLELANFPLERIAEQVGTPFYFYDGGELRARLADLTALTRGDALQARYAMKANSCWKILEEVRTAGLWIDAVSGNEVLRAKRAGFAMGARPPVVMLTADVLRDNALSAVLEEGVMPNVGSPGMIDELAGAGYRGPIAVRVNPGFGHGHVQSCDTGGPSSKHGIWHEALDRLGARAAAAKLAITTLHAHVGTGPQIEEFNQNLRQLVALLGARLGDFPDVEAVNLGGGIPHGYRPGGPRFDLAGFRALLTDATAALARDAGRTIRVEIEPGRFCVAGAGLLVCRVKDLKRTEANAKGPGHQFVMVDAGFNDLIRPAMYGAYHHISVVGKGTDRAPEPFVVAGPLCESGDVFTRDDRELLAPRGLPRPEVGDLLILHDAGAYGAAMSSNYVSIGRAPQVFWDRGHATLVSRREVIDDVLGLETNQAL
jgi:diaminopimelate decarboxylase